MKKQSQPSARTEPGACLCQGIGPLLSDVLRHLGPPEDARRHFEAARLEILKGIRALVDARIEQRAKTGGKKGQKIEVA